MLIEKMGNINKKHRLKANKMKLLPAKLKNVQKTYDESIFYATNYFKKLPDELIVHIFQFLPNYEALLSYCPQVCKRWKRISTDASLWKKVRLLSHTIHMDKLRKIATYGIHRLILLSCTIKDNEVLLFKNLYQNTINGDDLRYLYLEHTKMSIDSLINLLLYCFHLSEIHFHWQEMNDTVCQCIARNENLNTLDLYLCSGFITGSGMFEIFRKCTNIQNIELCIARFTEDDLTTMLDAIVEFSAIKIMSIRNYNVSDKHVQKITERCPNLTKLDLCLCKNLTASSVMYIANGLPKLEYLLLSCNNFIIPETLLQLRSSRSLTSLVILYEIHRPPFPNEIRERLEKSPIHVTVYDWPYIL